MLLVLASVLLMTLDHKQQHLASLRSGLQVVVYPIRFLVNLPVDVGHWVSESLATRQTLMEENASLRSQNLMLRAKLQKHTELVAQNRRLRQLLGSSYKVIDDVLIAELYEVDLDPYKHLIVVNKGSTDGARVDQPVLDAEGVMGQIIQVGAFTSTVRLITDPNHVIPVRVSRNGLRTIAVGTGAINRVELPYLPNNADIRPGDQVVTSGLGRLYPPGYPVAQVTRVTQDPGSEFARVAAQPTAQLDRSREVLLVLSKQQNGERENPDAAAEPVPEPAKTEN